MTSEIFQRVAAHALIVDDEGKMLVAHRTENNDWKPGEWDTFGGSIEMGEVDVEEALKREVREEGNISVEVGRLLDVYSSMSNGQRHQFQMTFLCTTENNDSDIVYEQDDHDEHRWVTLEELVKIPNKIAFLEQLCQKMVQRRIII